MNVQKCGTENVWALKVFKMNWDLESLIMAENLKVTTSIFPNLIKFCSKTLKMTSGIPMKVPIYLI